MPELHPLCEPLAILLGTWQGAGVGHYPTIEDFFYVEELTFGHVGKPFVSMTQRSRNRVTDEPLHSETGYVRALGDGAAELSVAPAVRHRRGACRVHGLVGRGAGAYV